MRVHSALGEALTAAVAEALNGLEHVAHGEGDPMAAAEAAAADTEAVALVGPLRSRAVAEVVEATAPAGLPLLAPLATWAGVTRDDEPGCDDPARHRGTVLRLVARDTEVARRIAVDVRAAGQRALVVGGGHEYGVQLDGQLRLVGLPRAADAAGADLVVLCGLAGGAEVERAAAAGLPVIAFDGVQGGTLPPDLCLALPLAPGEDHAGTTAARRAGALLAEAARGGAHDRASALAALRALGPFDEHGDPVGAPVWLWRAREGWALEPERELAG
jgi:hypothetical protein